MPAPRAVLITDDYMPHLGGSRVIYHKVASILAGEMAVVTRDRKGAAEFDAKANYDIRRVPLRRYGSPVSLLSELSAGYSFYRAALKFGAGPVFLAGEITPAAFAASFAARRRRVPYAVFVHDEPLMAAGPAEARLRKRVLRRAAAIIVSSSYPASRVRAAVGESAVIFSAPPGVDADVFRPGASDKSVLAAYGLSPLRYLVSVGRLVDYKNIDAVIDTVSDLSREGVKLVVAGEGPERQKLEARARELKVADRVIFAGRLANERVAALNQGALAFVFPSRRVGGMQHEGIGMAAMEAAACGAPVIASTATSAGDFIDDGRTGLFFDPEAAGELTLAVRTLLEDGKLREQMGREAAQRVRSSFTWERAAAVVREAIEFLHRGAGAPGARRA